MSYYKIAGLNVFMECEGELLRTRAKAYECTEKPDKVDIVVSVSKEFVEKKHQQYPNMSIEDCEYMWTGMLFYSELLKYNGFMLHASAVCVDDKAYFFSAPSGTGKSTHTGLWLKVFGERARILNDDKPAIRMLNDKIYAFGTPWSGKTDLNLNECVELSGICFLHRSETNHIKKIDNKDAIAKILDQTIRPLGMKDFDNLLNCVDVLLENISVYSMGCNISEDAARVAYYGMNGILEVQ